MFPTSGWVSCDSLPQSMLGPKWVPDSCSAHSVYPSSHACRVRVWGRAHFSRNSYYAQWRILSVCEYPSHVPRGRALSSRLPRLGLQWPSLAVATRAAPKRIRDTRIRDMPNKGHRHIGSGNVPACRLSLRERAGMSAQGTRRLPWWHVGSGNPCGSGNAPAGMPACGSGNPPACGSGNAPAWRLRERAG